MEFKNNLLNKNNQCVQCNKYRAFEDFHHVGLSTEKVISIHNTTAFLFNHPIWCVLKVESNQGCLILDN